MKPETELGDSDMYKRLKKTCPASPYENWEARFELRKMESAQARTGTRARRARSRDLQA